MTPDEVDAELLRLLRTGEITAEGVLQGDILKAFNPVPTERWAALRLDWSDFPHADGTIGGQYERWDRLHIDASEIYRAFPRTHATHLEKRTADRKEAEQRYDPMAECRWSIPMVVAWIATRAVSDVQRVWDEFRYEVGEEPADLGHLAPILKHEVAAAWRDLRRVAEAGTIIAQGIDERTDHGAALSPAVWRSMAVESRPSGLACVPKGAQLGYRDATFASVDVIKHWPAPDASKLGSCFIEAPDTLRGILSQSPSSALTPNDQKTLHHLGTIGGSQRTTVTYEIVPTQSKGEQLGTAAKPSEYENITRGNPPRLRRGAPSLQTDDDRAIREMRRLIEAGEARSPTQAANMVFSYIRIEGLGSDDSRLKRLVRRYQKQFSSSGSE